ncbi:hypothetical protein FKW77_007377 [Venturia effusa]|uniref:Uncharacterized protein n=1 Tax=Venturia effusa TaxID=50376 RepID=A0A517KZQ2_9PEZI|nr:hypothetical protein FKW77_007377 [Venturia effusa]
MIHPIRLFHRFRLENLCVLSFLALMASLDKVFLHDFLLGLHAQQDFKEVDDQPHQSSSIGETTAFWWPGHVKDVDELIGTQKFQLPMNVSISNAGAQHADPSSQTSIPSTTEVDATLTDGALSTKTAEKTSRTGIFGADLASDVMTEHTSDASAFNGSGHHNDQRATWFAEDYGVDVLGPRSPTIVMSNTAGKRRSVGTGYGEKPDAKLKSTIAPSGGVSDLASRCSGFDHDQQASQAYRPSSELQPPPNPGREERHPPHFDPNDFVHATDSAEEPTFTEVHHCPRSHGAGGEGETLPVELDLKLESFFGWRDFGTSGAIDWNCDAIFDVADGPASDYLESSGESSVAYSSGKRLRPHLMFDLDNLCDNGELGKGPRRFFDLDRLDENLEFEDSDFEIVPPDLPQMQGGSGVKGLLRRCRASLRELSRSWLIRSFHEAIANIFSNFRNIVKKVAKSKVTGEVPRRRMSEPGPPGFDSLRQIAGVQATKKDVSRQVQYLVK